MLWSIPAGIVEIQDQTAGGPVGDIVGGISRRISYVKEYPKK
jgi:hypothetical protein